MRLSPATRMGLSVALATGLYGISFGALAVAAGLDRLQTQLLSALMFTGGSQFAFIGTLAGGPIAATASASLLGVRNALYGAQLNALLRPSRVASFGYAQVSIDESFACAVGQDDPREQFRGFWSAGVGVYLLWNLFTFFGAWAGDTMGDPRTFGLDGAAVAAFLGLLWPRLVDRDAISIAVACAFVTLVAVPVLPIGLPLLVAAAAAVLVGAALHRLGGRRDVEAEVAP